MTLSKFAECYKWLFWFLKKDRLYPDDAGKSTLLIVSVLILTWQPVHANWQQQLTDTLTHQRTIKFEPADGLKLKPEQTWVGSLTGMITTKDTMIENVFNGQPVSVEKIISVTIYDKQKKVVQTLQGINESAWFDDYGKDKIAIGKLEDYNHDGYADLWIGFLPYTRLYDRDFAIYLYDAKKKNFGSKKYYLLQDLSEKELKKKLRGDGEN
jgi:hypothetical protein